MPNIEIELQRYNELIAKEERLNVVERALSKCFLTPDFDVVKRVFTEGAQTDDNKN